MSHTTPPSMATTVLKNVKKGISALSEWNYTVHVGLGLPEQMLGWLPLAVHVDLEREMS